MDWMMGYDESLESKIMEVIELSVEVPSPGWTDSLHSHFSNVASTSSSLGSVGLGGAFLHRRWMVDDGSRIW